jgi:hypothetical protein
LGLKIQRFPPLGCTPRLCIIATLNHTRLNVSLVMGDIELCILTSGMEIHHKTT